MEKKYVIILEIFAVIIAGGVYFVKEVMPSVQSEIRSSNLISTESYQGMVEFQIDHQIDFAVVFNQEGLIYHIFYFEPLSTCISESSIIFQDTLEEEISLIIKRLHEASMLKNLTSLTLTYYDTVPNELSIYLEKSFQTYQIISQITEEKSTLQKKATSLELAFEGKKILLHELDFYSKDILSSMEEDAFDFSKKRSIELANTVYMKLEKYVREHHIQELDRNQKEIPIETVSGDENELFYPDSNSWFRVSGGKVTAYIEFERANYQYGYCFQGAIDLKKEGEC